MEIDFFINFEKRTNSTKRPVPEGLVTKHTLTGILKEPCSVLKPVINIQNPITENAPCVYTYAYIPRFYRYYFVKDWVWNDGLWTVQLEVDVLATYKPHIGETSAYIERASADADGNSPYYDGNIIDKMYPAANDFETNSILLDAPWTGWDVGDGCYVVGVINQPTFITAGGAVQYYAMTQSELSALVDYLMSDVFYNNAGFASTNPNAQLTHDLAKAIINPIQYITSCMWFPCVVSDLTAANSLEIWLGPWGRTGCVGCPILDRVGFRKWFNVTVPSHPQAATRGTYLNYSPYSRFLCMLPPFGSFTIDPSYIPDNRVLHFVATVDGITGKACLQVGRDEAGVNERFFYESTSVLGVPIQLTQLATDYIGVAKSAVQTIGSAVTSVAASTFMGGVAGGLMTLSSIGNTLEALQPQVTSEGVNGSFIASERLIGIFPRMTSQFVKIVDEDNTEIGRPLCKVKRIDTLSGYIKCGECTVDFYAFESELTEIHSMMINGFFWE